jgi:hypothetical protein
MEVRYQLRYSPETSESEAYPAGDDARQPDAGTNALFFPVSGRSEADLPDTGKNTD